GHRGELEGAGGAAHPARVGHQRDPRHRGDRRHPGARHRDRPARDGAWLRRGGVRRHEPGRRVRGHRPHARDVQEQAPRPADMTEYSVPLLVHLAYLASAILFIVGLKRLSSPATARSGNMIAGVGMAVAVTATLLTPGLHLSPLLVAALVLG